jgi:WD40 repeat protein
VRKDAQICCDKNIHLKPWIFEAHIHFTIFNRHPVTTLRFTSRDITEGQTLIGSYEDNTIKLWNFGTGTLLRTLAGHSDWVLGTAISPDGQTLISSSRDKTIRIWPAQ